MSHSLQHLGTLCKYTGISFIAGAVNHGFFSGQRSLITAAIGAIMYVLGGVLLRRQSPSVSWSQLLGWGVVASVGLGFFTGGLQHFPDSPTRSAWVVPLGFFMFALAFAYSEMNDVSQRPQYARYAMLTGGVIAVVCIIAAKTMPPGAFDTDHHGKTFVPAQSGHGHGAHESQPTAATDTTKKVTKVTRQVEIILADTMRFTPENLVVKQGETIEFVLKNTGKVTHEWVFGKENDLVQHAKQMQAAAQHAGHNHGHDDSNKFDHDQGSSIQGARVNALENKSLIITFNETGEFTTACFEAGHFEAGMKGKLSVMPAQ